VSSRFFRISYGLAIIYLIIINLSKMNSIAYNY